VHTAGGQITNFERALSYTLENEGGFINDPLDRGGPTKWGITLATLAKWRQRPSGLDDIKNLTPAEMQDIYKAWYWAPLGCELIVDSTISTAMFDIGVVRGIFASAKCAQNVCRKLGANALVVDGHIGPSSIIALNAMPKKEFIYSFTTYAETGFRATAEQRPSQRKFLNGWLARADRLRSLV
jgi:lysozyme family protein